jgi:hypothetical protein
MMKYVVLLALTLFTSLSGWAFSSTTPIFGSSVHSAGKSRCFFTAINIPSNPGEITLKPAAATCARPLLVIPFANLDQMIYHQTTGEFAYWYAETEKLVRCRLLSLATLYPVDIPYYRE